ncbi:Nitrogen assimilation regulatory protein [Candidatus Venteria ishoeyi]|nr:Nitrogen assimilation regulatory protein [Candidatus Venteria ishoeyi]
MASGQEILPEDLPKELQQQQHDDNANNDWEQGLHQWAEQQLQSGCSALLDEALPRFERVMINTALNFTHGRRQEAAKLLGWGRNTITRKIKELEITALDKKLE